MTVIYPGPLMVLCDSPKNYRRQAGIEFLREKPTVWDESVVLSGEVGRSIVIARRSGERWYLAAMNGDDAAQLPARLKFLGKGRWTLRGFADKADSSDYEAVVESTRDVNAESFLPLSLAPGGGFAGIISKAKRRKVSADRSRFKNLPTTSGPAPARADSTACPARAVCFQRAVRRRR